MHVFARWAERLVLAAGISWHAGATKQTARNVAAADAPALDTDQNPIACQN